MSELRANHSSRTIHAKQRNREQGLLAVTGPRFTESTGEIEAKGAKKIDHLRDIAFIQRKGLALFGARGKVPRLKKFSPL
jgi:hypothetical protein